VNVTKEVTVSENGVVDNVQFTLPKLTNSTGVTYTANSITLGANTNALFAGEPTTGVDEGFVVTFTIGGHPTGGWTARGGFYMAYQNNANVPHTRFVVEQVADYNNVPVLSMYTWFKSANWDAAARKAITGDYDYSKPLTMQFVYYNKAMYFKIGDWTSVLAYDGRETWSEYNTGNAMSGNITGNSQSRMLGLMSMNYATTFTNVQYGIGNEIAQAEIEKTFSDV
jgi:hypothetical protein